MLYDSVMVSLHGQEYKRETYQSLLATLEGNGQEPQDTQTAEDIYAHLLGEL